MSKIVAERQDQAPARPLRRRFLVLICLAGCLVVCAAGGGLAWHWALSQRPPAVEAAAEPPTVDPTGGDPAVLKAIEAARAEVLRAPRSGAAWGRLGMVLFAHDYHAEADACFAEAERLDPQEPRWPYLHGVDLATTDPEGAIRKVRQAVALCDDSALAPRLRLAELLLAQDQFDEAAGLFRAAVKVDPRCARAELGLGQIAYRRGDLQESIGHFQVALQDPHSWKAAQTGLAQVYQRLGKPEAAETALRAAAAAPRPAPWRDPWGEEAIALQTGLKAAAIQAVLLTHAGRYDQSIALLRQTARDYPKSEQPWLLMGQAYTRKRDLPAAEEVLRKAVAMAPDAAEAHFRLGVVLWLRDQPGPAAECFRKAIARQPDMGAAYYNLGQCLEKLGDRAGAIEALGKDLECRPNHADAHYVLGDLLARDGKNAEAVEHLRQAVALAPQSAQARQRLEEVSKLQK